LCITVPSINSYWYIVTFAGVTVEDFRKADSDGEQIIEALQFKFQCSIIVRSNRDTR